MFYCSKSELEKAKMIYELLTIDRLDSIDIILGKWVFARVQRDIIWEHQRCWIIGVRES